MNDKIRDKIAEENQLIRYFQSIFDDFPKGKVIKSESPDFILQLSRHKQIGIELTKLFLIKNDQETHFILHYEDQQKALIEAFKNLFFERFSFQLHMHFKFSREYPIEAESIEKMAGELMSCLKDFLETIPGRGYFYGRLKSRNLPDWLESLHMVHHPDDSVSDWVSCEHQIPAENFIESIQLLIDQKEEKMNIYQKSRLDSYWLLIVADCLNCATNYNINNLLSRWQFGSKFERIYLFELYAQKIHVLNN